MCTYSIFDFCGFCHTFSLHTRKFELSYTMKKLSKSSNRSDDIVSCCDSIDVFHFLTHGDLLLFTTDDATATTLEKEHSSRRLSDHVLLCDLRLDFFCLLRNHTHRKLSHTSYQLSKRRFLVRVGHRNQVREKQRES